MTCIHCGVWELSEGDLVCGWCGAGYLLYTVSLDPPVLSTEDYPPPVELCVRNISPIATLTLERIQASATWIIPLPRQDLPQRIAPGTQHRFYLDVDTFAAGSQTEAAIAVFALHAPNPQSATLQLHSSNA